MGKIGVFWLLLLKTAWLSQLACTADASLQGQPGSSGVRHSYQWQHDVRRRHLQQQSPPTALCTDGCTHAIATQNGVSFDVCHCSPPPPPPPPESPSPPPPNPPPAPPQPPSPPYHAARAHPPRMSRQSPSAATPASAPYVPGYAPGPEPVVHFGPFMQAQIAQMQAASEPVSPEPEPTT